MLKGPGEGENPELDDLIIAINGNKIGPTEDRDFAKTGRTELEEAVIAIAKAGRGNEIFDQLLEIAYGSAFPGERATAVDSLATLDSPEIGSILIDLLQRETSVLVQGCLVRHLGLRGARGAILLIRSIQSNNTGHDPYLAQACEEALIRLE